MTDEEEATIRARVPDLRLSGVVLTAPYAYSDMLAILAEVERLRANLDDVGRLLAAIQAENASLHNTIDRERQEARETFDLYTDAANRAGDVFGRVQVLEAENAAMREIVQAVATMPMPRTDMDNLYCPFCHEEGDEETIEHTADCSVTKARALLGKEAQAEE